MIPELHTRFDAAVTAALDGATVVTVTTRATRMLLAEAIRRLRATSGACRTPDILPLDAFYRRLWQDALVTGAVSDALLSPGRTHALWRKVISQTRHSGNLLTAHGSARMAQDAWRIAQQYRIRLDERAVRGIPECEAFFEWSSLYKEECRRGGWIDASALPEALIGRLDQIGSAVPKRLVVYGFDVLTPQTSAFCEALKKSGAKVEAISSQVSDKVDAARVIDADTVDDEFRLAAAWARQKLIASTSQRIGVVVPGLRELREQIEAAFAEVLHPEEFLSPALNPDRVFEVAAGRALDDYAMVLHALLLLRFTFSDVPIHDLGILLRSPYIGDSSESSARAMFDVALRTKGRPQYSAASLRTAISTGPENLRVPDKLLRMIRQLANLAPPSTKLFRPSEAADTFSDALGAADWPSREPDSAEYQLGERWDALLGEFASLDGFLPPQSSAAMVEELARMAASVSFRPENSGAPVQIMEEDEAAGCAFDALWVCGLSDDWPQARRANPYLPLALQRAAGVPNLAPGEQHAAAAATLARFTASANDVVLSSARQNNERELRPNRLLSQFVSGTVADLCGTIPTSYGLFQSSSAALEFVDDRVAPAADPEKLPRRGTEVLKLQALCPFHAFVQLRLGAEKIESPEIGVDRRLRGNLVETALEAFWSTVRTSHNLNGGIPQQDVDAALTQAIDHAIDKCLSAPNSSSDERLRAIERRRLQGVLKRWLRVEAQRTDFEVIAHQQEFNFTIGPLTLHGYIDRLDRVAGEDFVVIDYKSGRKAPSLAEWTSDRPGEPQVPVYAVHVSREHELSGIAFAQVSAVSPAFKGCAQRRDILALGQDSLKRYFGGRTIAQQVREWTPTLERLASDFIAGDSGVDPKNPPGVSKSSCRYCHLQSACRVAEITFAAPNDDDAGGDDE